MCTTLMGAPFQAGVGQAEPTAAEREARSSGQKIRYPDCMVVAVQGPVAPAAAAAQTVAWPSVAAVHTAAAGTAMPALPVHTSVAAAAADMASGTAAAAAAAESHSSAWAVLVPDSLFLRFAVSSLLWWFLAE